ncbi:pullulanase-associated domain-containing protein [Streptomyces sp. NPDC054940]
MWLTQGSADVLTSPPAGSYSAQGTTKAIIHYHRADGDFTGWGLHVWAGAATGTDRSSPSARTRTAPSSRYRARTWATSLSYIIHKGNTKDLDADQSLDLTVNGHEVWLLGGTEKYLLPQFAASSDALDLSTAKARWIDEDTVAWDTRTGAASYQLVYGPADSIEVKDGVLTSEGHLLRLQPVPGGLTDAQQAAYPELKDYTAFIIDPRDRERVKKALAADQLIATQRLTSGALFAATGVRTQDVRNDLGTGE